MTGIIAVYQGIQQILIQVEALDPVNKVANLALLTTFVAITSLIGLPLGGAISDHTSSRFGRRTPWIVGTSVVSGVLMIAMGFADNQFLLGVIYTALWLTSNTYQGAVTAILPDRIAESRRGVASTLIGLATPLGVLVGVNVASRVGQIEGYTIIALVFVVTALALVLGTREGSSLSLPLPAARENPGIAHAVRGFFEAFASRDFTLAFVSRLFRFLSHFTVSGFLFLTSATTSAPTKSPAATSPRPSSPSRRSPCSPGSPSRPSAAGSPTSSTAASSSSASPPSASRSRCSSRSSTRAGPACWSTPSSRVSSSAPTSRWTSP
ncbi:MAG: MFS transporter [Burkholderiaceae bacterium]|nr:MFS transporter [Microbacteriaceae bacterium]